MKKSLTQLVGALVLLIVALAAYGVWYAQVRAQSDKAAELHAEIQQKSQATTRTAAAKAQLSQLAPQEAEVNQYFVSTNDVVSFLEQLTETGKFLGADVQVTSVSATQGTPYGSLNLSLKISGSFQAVMRTLGSIEYGAYDIRTASVTLDGGQGGTGSGSANATWTAAAVFVISTQAPTKTPAATTTARVVTTPASTSVQRTTPAATSTPPSAQSANPVSTSTASGVGTPSS